MLQPAHPRPFWRRLGPAIRGALLALALTAAPALAQIALPTPAIPALPDLTGAAREALPDAREIARLTDMRRLQLRDLLRAHRDVLETDPRGAVIVRNELIAVGPTAAALSAARAGGFTVTKREPLDGFDTAIVTLAAPQGVSTRRALDLLRQLDPRGVYDFNHIYAQSGVARAAPAGESGGGAVRVGLIDTGVDARHPTLAGARVTQRSFAGATAPALHGTAVASLMVGRGEGFHGAAPGSDLFAADVYGAGPTGGSASGIVQAFSWMAQERVGVVNISLVGPPNRVMESVIASMVSRGHIVVAAVGNDGPAAPPLYPAAYPGVVGVTGVTARNRALVEAGRGDQVDFAAPGADMLAADAAAGMAPVRGTSFAAPIVAGLLARRLPVPDPAGAARAIAALATQAEDLGARGRDPVYGAGLVGVEVRTLPRQALAGR